jgi:hypothetical protein
MTVLVQTNDWIQSSECFELQELINQALTKKD